MNTGLYFGSFNPVHIGHLAIANYIIEYSDLDEIWFVVSPQNPLKIKTTLLADHHRIRLVELAVEGDERFRVSDIETKMPLPSYTIDTLAWLGERNPSRKFSLIMGGDNLATLHKWKNAVQILSSYRLIVYPRRDRHHTYPPELESLIAIGTIEVIDAPQMDISGTFIRSAIAEGKDIRHFLPPAVWKYIDEMNFYR